MSACVRVRFRVRVHVCMFASAHICTRMGWSSCACVIAYPCVCVCVCLPVSSLIKHLLHEMKVCVPSLPAGTTVGNIVLNWCIAQLHV